MTVMVVGGRLLLGVAGVWLMRPAGGFGLLAGLVEKGLTLSE